MSERDIVERLREDHDWPCVYGEPCVRCKAITEIERLRAIVEPMEETLDGVKILPGESTVWSWRMVVYRHKRVVDTGDEPPIEFSVETPQPYAETDYDWLTPEQASMYAYSTREAAEVARKGGTE